MMDDYFHDKYLRECNAHKHVDTSKNVHDHGVTCTTSYDYFSGFSVPLTQKVESKIEHEFVLMALCWLVGFGAISWLVLNIW